MVVLWQAWYGMAIAESWVRMPLGTLELQVAPIEMPFPVTETLLLEPWINPFRCHMRRCRPLRSPSSGQQCM